MSADRWDAATAGLVPPFAVVDLEAFDANAADLLARAGGLPLRVASKSVRCRPLLRRALQTPGFAGVMASAAPEAIWLVRQGFADVFVAYPSVELYAALAGAARSSDHPLKVAIDVDASLRVGPLHLGVRRSPIRTAEEAVAVARAAVEAGMVVEGAVFYDAQIAGVPDDNPAVRLMERRSHAQLQRRGRSSRLCGLSRRCGSSTVRAPGACTSPAWTRPARGMVTLFSGGYLASGPAGASRVPRLRTPEGLRALRRAPPRPGRRGRPDGPDLPRRGPVLRLSR